MQDDLEWMTALERPLPFWRARHGLPGHVDAVFDRATGELYERDFDGWQRTSAWPTLRVRSRPFGQARWRPDELQAEVHWPPRPEFHEDHDGEQGQFDFMDARFVLGPQAVGAWTRLIPERVRQLVAPFPELHASLLRWASGGPACVDLIAANPALALLASEYRRPGDLRRTHVMSELHAFVEAGASQRALLAKLDLPANESTRRLLRKVRPYTLGFDALVRLAHLIGEAVACARLRHLPEVTRNVIRIVSDPTARALVSDAFLLRIVEDDRRAVGSVSRANDTDADVACMRVSTLAWLRRELQSQRPLLVTSHATLHRAFRESHEELAARRQATREDLVLPPPPVPGTSFIVPLHTERELMQEGRAQRHCAGAMAGEVLAGEVAIYRVLAPERATLCLEATARGWVVRDLRGRCNQEVSSATWNAVKAWLRGAREL